MNVEALRAMTPETWRRQSRKVEWSRLSWRVLDWLETLDANPEDPLFLSYRAYR